MGAWRKRGQVTLADIVQSDGYVDLDDFTPTGDALVSFCSGNPWELPAYATAETADVEALLADAPGFERYRMRVCDVADMRKRTTAADNRLASKLGIDADHLLGLAWALWKRPYSEERDRRAGPNRRARVATAKQLTTELQAQLWKESQHGNN